jgi:hypothetical protein
VNAACDQGDLQRAAHLLARVWTDGPKRSPDEVDPQVRARAVSMLLDLFELGVFKMSCRGGSCARPGHPQRGAPTNPF